MINKWQRNFVNLLYEVSKANGDLFNSPNEWRKYLRRMGLSDRQVIDLQEHGEWVEPVYYSKD